MRRKRALSRIRIQSELERRGKLLNNFNARRSKTSSADACLFVLQTSISSELRDRDAVIGQQEEESRIAARHKQILSDKRIAFDGEQTTHRTCERAINAVSEICQHLELRHDKQRKQLVAAQDRNIAYYKTLNEMATRHLRVWYFLGYECSN